MDMRTTRRSFLQLLSSAAAVVGGGIFFRRANAQDDTGLAGERYGDFVILPYDARVPADVVSTGPPPRFEGGNSASVVERINDESLLRTSSGLIIYKLASPPGEVRGPVAELVRNEQGQVASASLYYETFSAELNDWTRSIEVRASEAFLWPVPVWETMLDGKSYPPQPVLGLPSTAVLTVTGLGYLVQWLDRNVLHSLRVENNPTPGFLADLLKTLARA